jgi:hypothetical protein
MFWHTAKTTTESSIVSLPYAWNKETKDWTVIVNWQCTNPAPRNLTKAMVL